MALTISNESKNSLSITNEDKASGYTWDDHGEIWDEATATWGESGGFPLVKESKNSLTITNETKN